MQKEYILVWDENKRQRNIVERGIDFIEAAAVLSDPNVSIVPDIREDYGEERFNAYGISDGRKMRVCFTPRDGKIRIITMFKVRQKEWSKYYEKND